MAAQELHDLGEVEIEEADIVGDWQRPSHDVRAGTSGSSTATGWSPTPRSRGAERGDAAVHPDYRGRGIGTALAGWTQELARARGSSWDARAGRLRRRPAAGVAGLLGAVELLGARLPEGAPIEASRCPPATRSASRRRPTTTRDLRRWSRTRSSSGPSATADLRGLRARLAYVPASSPGTSAWSSTRRRRGRGCRPPVSRGRLGYVDRSPSVSDRRGQGSPRRCWSTPSRAPARTARPARGSHRQPDRRARALREGRHGHPARGSTARSTSEHAAPSPETLPDRTQA